MIAGEEEVDGGDEEEREGRADGIPATSTRPMLLRAAAPGPVTSVRGKWPQTVATLVMRIGRSRVTAASCTASSLAMPLLLQLVRELHDEDAVLRHQPDERHQPHLRVDVERGRQAVREEGHVRVRHLEEGQDERAEHAERHRAGQDDERVAEAVELRGEHEEDEHHREEEGGQELVALRPQLARLARVVDGVALRQDLGGLALEEARAPRRAAGWPRPLSFTALSCWKRLSERGVTLFRDRGDGGERDELAVRAGDVDVLQLLGVQPVDAQDCGITL